MVFSTQGFIRRAPRREPAHAARGFTAVELMTVIGILAILVALALPSFDYLIQRWRVRDATQAMTSTLYLARSEAIRRGCNIVVAQGTPAGGACAAGDWGCGWTVRDDGALIQSYSAPPNLNVASKLTEVQFDRWGALDMAKGQQAGFTIYPSSAGVESAVTVTLCVNRGGRIWTQRGEATCS